MEEWTSSDIGSCAEKMLYKIHQGPRIRVWRKGHDDLRIRNILVTTEAAGSMFEYNCGDFVVVGECQDAVMCQDFQHCTSHNNNKQTTEEYFF